MPYEFSLGNRSSHNAPSAPGSAGKQALTCEKRACIQLYARVGAWNGHQTSVHDRYEDRHDTEGGAVQKCVNLLDLEKDDVMLKDQSFLASIGVDTAET